MRSRAAKTQLRVAEADPDTVWIGHIADAAAHAAFTVHGTPGGYGPYHIGRGPNRIVGGRLGPNSSYNGVWDFDHFQAADGTAPNLDSLMGWWPITCPFGSVGPSNLPDVNRPWFCLDYGNQGNYVINQGSPKRTFGVVGYWHMETKGGTMKAWCGLNAHGTNTPVDNVTGNPFNSDVLNYQGNNSGRQTGSLRSSGTDKHFPGYGSQWDQILYRDVDLSAAAAVVWNYSRSTNMDVRRSGTFNSQAGYFMFDPWGDPLAPAAFGGIPAFISANQTIIAGGSSTEPIDRFEAYYGKPVEPVGGVNNDFTASDGALHDLYDAERPSDPYHRWLSEVIDISTLVRGENIWGNNALGAANGGAGITIPAAFIGTCPVSPRDGTKHVVRLVFRVKTNRGFDDENSGNAGGYSSGGNGAALVTSVTIGGVAIANPLTAAGDIDNTQTAFDRWRSTGKPPGVFAHLHDYASLGITDPCGAAEAAIRFCNSYGNAMSPGDHDISDKHAGGFAAGLPQIRRNSHMRQKHFMSPTINLMSSGVGDYNGMGINSEIASRKLVFNGDQVLNIYNFPVTGNGFRYTYQGYPSNQATLGQPGDGVATWGESRFTFFFNFVTVRGCFETIIGIPSEDQLILSSNAPNHPDSCRVGIQAMARCYTIPSLPEAACSPTTGPNSGGTYDNFTVGFATAPPPAALALDIWNRFNDCFPVNSTNQVPTAIAGNGFDTTSVLVQTGFNQSDDTGQGGANGAHVVAGDTAYCTASGENVRIDLVFRILPGVGNYVTIGDRTSGLVRRVTVSGAPRGAVGNVSVSGDTSFWGQYMANNGVYGTGGGGVGSTHAAQDAGGLRSGWSANVWNSARCDTVELNEFPRTSFDGNLPLLTPGQYASMYNELDPKFISLGIRKNRCVLQDKVVGNTETTNDTRFIRCTQTPPPGFQATDPNWPGAEYSLAASGMAASEFAASGPGSNVVRSYPAGSRGETFEYTEIIPHGLLTPGAHVEYFFRKSIVGDAIAYDLGPDTNFVFPQVVTGNSDYKRWDEFSVLPDRWKDSAFPYGGTGMACMLVVDQGERRGEHAAWCAMADSTGLTSASRRGAHSGWSAAYGVTVEGNVGTNNNVCVRPHLGQAGSLWDLYQVVAGESNVPSGRFGERYANEANCGLECGKFARHGPSQAMLLNFYKEMVWLNGDAAEESFGPFLDETSNDIYLLDQFLKTAGADPARSLPRGLLMAGDDMVNGAAGTSVDAVNFFQNDMLVTARFDDYRQNGGIANDIADFNTTIYSISAGDGNMPAATQQTYGVFNPCFIKNDVLNAQAGGVVSARYENTGSGNSPYTASVYANDDGARDARTYTLGTRIGLMGSRRTSLGGLWSHGTRLFFTDLLPNIWKSFGSCTPSLAPIVGVGDGPGSSGKAFVDFMNLRSDNPMRSGEARIAFGLSKTERVEIKVYDVSGRLVKTLANRIFVGGQEHTVNWDGTNDAGIKVARGVYFYQLRSPSFVSQKKLAVLKN
ncbi:MAG TPA: FlgD immunoglobulin-like domain containing protein [Candidatus Eisenbacteria bacterium]